MEITVAPNGVLQIDEARIIHRNFSGRGSAFNREGDKNFSIIIPTEEMANMLIEDGWNVKIRPPKTPDEDPFMYLPVKLKFTEYGPNIKIKSGPIMRPIDEETVSIIDNMDIEYVDLDIRPFNWEVNGKTGKSAYLKQAVVVQRVDRLSEKYNEY